MLRLFKMCFLIFIALPIIFMQSCKFEKEDDLYNFVKPYLGIYECKSATVGGEEKINDFLYYKAELTKDKIIIKNKVINSDAEKITEYNYSFNDGMITVEDSGKNVSADYSEGVITIYYSSGNIISKQIFARN